MATIKAFNQINGVSRIVHQNPFPALLTIECFYDPWNPESSYCTWWNLSCQCTPYLALDAWHSHLQNISILYTNPWNIPQVHLKICYCGTLNFFMLSRKVKDIFSMLKFSFAGYWYLHFFNKLGEELLAEFWWRRCYQPYDQQLPGLIFFTVYARIYGWFLCLYVYRRYFLKFKCLFVAYDRSL